MINIIAELPDGCFPVFVYEPHPCGGSYCVEAPIYGLRNRRPRFIFYPPVKGEYMSEQDKDLAKEHAARAARQAKHAAHNVSEAAEFEKEHIVESINQAADPIDPHGLMKVLTDLGAGVFASAVAVASATIATQKFRAAYVGRGRMVRK